MPALNTRRYKTKSVNSFKIRFKELYSPMGISWNTHAVRYGSLAKRERKSLPIKRRKNKHENINWIKVAWNGWKNCITQNKHWFLVSITFYYVYIIYLFNIYYTVDWLKRKKKLNLFDASHSSPPILNVKWAAEDPNKIIIKRKFVLIVKIVGWKCFFLPPRQTFTFPRKWREKKEKCLRRVSQTSTTILLVRFFLSVIHIVFSNAMMSERKARPNKIKYTQKMLWTNTILNGVLFSLLFYLKSTQRDIVLANGSLLLKYLRDAWGYRRCVLVYYALKHTRRRYRYFFIFFLLRFFFGFCFLFLNLFFFLCISVWCAVRFVLMNLLKTLRAFFLHIIEIHKWCLHSTHKQWIKNKRKSLTFVVQLCFLPLWHL